MNLRLRFWRGTALRPMLLEAFVTVAVPFSLPPPLALDLLRKLVFELI